MKAKILFLGLCIWFAPFLQAQSVNQLLDSVKTNSPQIKALNSYLKAKKMESKTNILPSDPKLGFGIFPSAINSGDIKQIFRVSQEFDFPTIYIQRSKLTKLNVREAEEYVNLEILNILTEFQNLLIQYVYSNKNEEVLDQRINALNAIMEALNKKFELGDATYLEVQKAKIELGSAKTSKGIVQAKKQALLEKISYHSGLELTTIENMDYPIYSNMDLGDLLMARVANSPSIAIRSIHIKQTEQQVKLAKSNWIPSFEIGFEMEKTPGENFRGLGFGMSLPIWNSLNKTKLAKAQFQLSNSNYENDLIQSKSETKSLYFEMIALEKSYSELKKLINQDEFKNLLKKAFDLGEVSVIEYFNELKVMFDIQDQTIELEKEYKLLQTALYNYTL